MFTKTFLLDLLERALSTFAQAFLGAYAVVGAQKAATAAAIAAGLAVLKGLAASRVGDSGTASLLPADDESGAVEPGSLALGLVLGFVLLYLLFVR